MTSPMAVHQMCAYATAAGALSHWTYFIHGEHHVQAPHLLGISMASPILICLGIWKLTNLDAPQAAILAAKLVGSYSTALWSSILLYRVFFHRLRAFPGPWMAKTSKLWHVWKLAPRSDNFRQLDKLHREYGDYVRTGKYLNLSHKSALATLGSELTLLQVQAKYPSLIQKLCPSFLARGPSARKQIGTMRITPSYRFILFAIKGPTMPDAGYGIVALAPKVWFSSF
jgi:hypothetical protein